MLIKTTKGRVLGFDIENMPLTYYAPDYPTARITAIATMWEGDRKSLHVCYLDPFGHTTGGCSPEEILTHFVERYNQATLVTGHYIRKHDLPHINAALVDAGMNSLGSISTSDSKDDLVRMTGLPKNLEYLIARLEIKTPKKHMTQLDWREANMFTAKGLAGVQKRVGDDVIGQLQLRQALIKKGYLKAPRLWTP